MQERDHSNERNSRPKSPNRPQNQDPPVKHQTKEQARAWTSFSLMQTSLSPLWRILKLLSWAPIPGQDWSRGFQCIYTAPGNTNMRGVHASSHIKICLPCFLVFTALVACVSSTASFISTWCISSTVSPTSKSLRSPLWELICFSGERPWVLNPALFRSLTS